MKLVLVVLVLLGMVPAQTDPSVLARTKGKAGAPVTVYEMADFQCPACRAFTVNVFPALEREYVVTGKVRWVFINMPLTSIHPNALAAAEVAMCAGRQGRFWRTHDLLYQKQDDWAPLAAPQNALVALARQAGADRGKLLACLKAGTARAEVQQEAERARGTGARSTPSFYIEGGLLEGAPYAPDPMRKILDSIYAARTSGPRS